MSITYDERKNKENIDKHGVSFDYVAEFNWESAITVEDTRYDYGENRYISYGLVGDRVYVLVWTPRNGIRPISFRKANKREVKRYEQEA